MSEQNMDTQIKGGKTGGGADGFRVSVGDLQSRRILQEEQGISNETSTPTSTPTTIFPISCDFDKVYDQADTRGVQQNRTLCGFTNGAGDTRRSMWISLLWQWAFFLPLAFLVGPVFGFGLLGVWIVNGIYRVGQALNCAHQWKSRKWARVQI